MSLENARAVYPIMVQLARDLSQAAKERRPVVWITYDDLCARCKEVGVKETPRTIAAKLLKPLQAACLEKNLPDLSALIIQKPKARGDFGDLLRPTDAWWEPYVASNMSTVGSVPFWFKEFQSPATTPTGPPSRSFERGEVTNGDRHQRTRRSHGRGRFRRSMKDRYDRSSLVGDFMVTIDDQTEEEYLRRCPEGRFCEFIDGVVYMPSPVALWHQFEIQFSRSCWRRSPLVGEPASS